MIVKNIYFSNREVYKESWWPPDGQINHVLFVEEQASDTRVVSSCRVVDCVSDHYCYILYIDREYQIIGVLGGRRRNGIFLDGVIKGLWRG
jgi:hypothetical protein